MARSVLKTLEHQNGLIVPNPLVGTRGFENFIFLTFAAIFSFAQGDSVSLKLMQLVTEQAHFVHLLFLVLEHCH
jgi:hypothetical protein